jgi:hypothetical protein
MKPPGGRTSYPLQEVAKKIIGKIITSPTYMYAAEK